MMRKISRTQAEKSERVTLVAALFIILGAIAIGRLFYLQVYKYKTYASLAESQHLSKDTIFAKRGQIFAEDSISGTPYLLASNQTLNLIYIDPKELVNKDDAFNKLSPIIGISVSDLDARYDPSSRYIILAHRLTNDQSDAISKLNIAGVGLQPENWRYYPEGSLSAAVLGFVNNEGIGNYGLEQHYNDILTGVNGYLDEETDAHGIQITFGNNVSKPAVNGSDIYLTIDKYIQATAEQYLADTIKKYSADSGQVIVMDKTSGKILAMANAPTFDPNNFTSQKDLSVFRNRSVTDVYEPGSVFKAITMSAGLDSGKITPQTTFDDKGYTVVDGVKISNALTGITGAKGVVDMSFVLEQSLNTGTTFIEQQMGKQIYYNYVKKFGFGAQTGIEADNEGLGVVYQPDQVGDLGYATMSFGQGVSVTPLQMVTAYAAIANGGKEVEPYMVDKIVDANGNTTATTQTKVKGQVISAKSASEVTQMLINTVNKGEGFQAKIAGYQVAGKTGTAQVPNPDGSGYEVGVNEGTFIGYAVAPNANFVVLAKIDNPRGTPWAEESAAPLVGQMLSFLLKYYQIPPTN
jgi:stage V sporulation protein D (sporulation-specific penicillin-binding protein)